MILVWVLGRVSPSTKRQADLVESGLSGRVLRGFWFDFGVGFGPGSPSTKRQAGLGGFWFDFGAVFGPGFTVH